MENAERTIEFTFEKSETLVLRRTPGIIMSWCDACERDVEMTSPEGAAAIFNMPKRKIYREIEAGRVHFVELPDGALLVCLVSVVD